MALHGSASSPPIWHNLAGNNPVRAAALRASASTSVGFRHFLGDPAPADRFTVDRIPYDPSDRGLRKRAKELLLRLARRLEREPPPPGTALPPRTVFDNPNIPSGYTYFFQLVAHDLVHSTAFLSLSEGRLATVANTRGTALRLETIFSLGPAARPELYERKTDKSKFHPLLRLGPIREDGILSRGSAPSVRPELLDIARGRCPFSMPQRATGLPEAIIGDGRNDDHPLLSQLVVLFHYVHNSIVGEIAAVQPPEGNPFDADHLYFLGARAATTLIYRNIIRHDLLQRLLHPAVREAYEAKPNLVRDRAIGRTSGWTAPLELTHLVLRAAHSMIRPSYQFNARSPFEEFTLKNMLLQSSDDQPDQMPLQRKWAVDWTFFFGSNPVNYSRRIRPHFDQHLSDDSVFPSENGDNVAGLAYRDLLSGIDTKPWSLAGLVRSLWPTHGSLLSLSPFFAEAQTGATGSWERRVAEWLGSEPAIRPAEAFTASDIDSLSRDPPLGVFAALEAMHDPIANNGERFGIFGSIILADVFYDILRNDELIPGSFQKPLKRQMEELSRATFPVDHDLLSFIPEIATFDGLLEFMKPRMPQLPSN